MFMLWLCVKLGSTNIGWHINVHNVKIFCTHISVKLNVMEIWERAIHGLNGWGLVLCCIPYVPVVATMT